jgi:hypothetical protein
LAGGDRVDFQVPFLDFSALGEINALFDGDAIVLAQGGIEGIGDRHDHPTVKFWPQFGGF